MYQECHYDNGLCLLKKLKGLEDDVKDRWNNVSHFIGVCVKKSHKVPEWEEICADAGNRNIRNLHDNT